MSHLLIVKRLELYMDLALYKINILLLMALPHGLLFIAALLNWGANAHPALYVVLVVLRFV